MIKLYPNGGLCNRMRAIDSAISLANKAGMKLTVFWEQNKDLNSPFLELFEPIPEVEIIECKRFPFLFQSGSLKNLFLPKLIRKVLKGKLYDESETKRLGDQDHSFKEFSDYNNIWIKGYTRFYKNAAMYQSFKPVAHIIEAIGNETKLFNDFTIGVHIRRTDNEKSIKNSPLDLYISTMTQELENEPLTNFYVASDDLNVKLELLNQFGNKLITNCDIVTRDTKEGMVRAVIELFSLSETKKVYGSYWSSFSHTACDITGIPEHTIKI